MNGPFIQIRGVEQVAARFRRLPRQMVLEVQEKALRKAAKPIEVYAWAKSPEDTGLFRESIGTILWPQGALRAETNIVMAIVGSRRGTRYGGRANITHLLERGWRTARGGTLKRTSGKTAAVSSITGKRGEGVAVGRHPGFQMFEQAARVAGPQSRAVLRAEIPRIIERVWKRKYAGA